MKSKNELIRAIDIKLKNNLTNALLSKELNQELLKKNLNVNLTGALFNGLKERPIDIDWNTYTIRSLEPLPERISQLVFYVDLEFVNNYTINTTKAYSRREHDNKYFL